MGPGHVLHITAQLGTKWAHIKVRFYHIPLPSSNSHHSRLSFDFSLRDETDAIFIDRDPKLFSIILNYLRTKEIDIRSCDIRVLRHEAEFYNISPLIKRLMLCEEMDQSSCGDVLFYGYLPAPSEFDGVVFGRGSWVSFLTILQLQTFQSRR